jgi:hypothetical protein
MEKEKLEEYKMNFLSINEIINKIFLTYFSSEENLSRNREEAMYHFGKLAEYVDNICYEIDYQRMNKDG